MPTDIAANILLSDRSLRLSSKLLDIIFPLSDTADSASLGRDIRHILNERCILLSDAHATRGVVTDTILDARQVL
jgi:hypothetical protein